MMKFSKCRAVGAATLPCFLQLLAFFVGQVSQATFHVQPHVHVISPVCGWIPDNGSPRAFYGCCPVTVDLPDIGAGLQRRLILQMEFGENLKNNCVGLMALTGGNSQKHFAEVRAPRRQPSACLSAGVVLLRQEAKRHDAPM